MDFLNTISKSEIVGIISMIVTALLFIAGAIEKLFDKKYVGTWFCAKLWQLIRFFWKWFMTPFRPVVERLKRNEQLEEIKNSLDIIQKEVTPNGGGSIKDIVGQLKEQNEELKQQGNERWHVMMGVYDFTKELSVRMDIADESANRMSFKLDKDKSCIYVSENFLRFFGYTPNDVLGSTWEFCLSPKEVRSVRAKWKTAFETRKQFHNEQFIIDSDAKKHLCLVRGIPLENKDKIFIGFFGTVEVLESLDD